jgi:holo-[acyl-carrier protein] synthase
MIAGIGVDLVDIARFDAGLQRFGMRLAEKLLDEQELRAFHAAPRPAQFLAGRFAAKEAFAKALGTGFRLGVYPREIGVRNDALGKPELAWSQALGEILRRRGIAASHLSLSDERGMVVAFVVLERG